jgi:hypothetical protein
MKRKFATALTDASAIPTMRPQGLPETAAAPAAKSTIPSSRWIQPHAETSSF